MQTGFHEQRDALTPPPLSPLAAVAQFLGGVAGGAGVLALFALPGLHSTRNLIRFMPLALLCLNLVIGVGFLLVPRRRLIGAGFLGSLAFCFLVSGAVLILRTLASGCRVN
jgi:hypothetical protein